MKTYTTDWIRNVGIVGHGDTGKTQLASSLLYTAGVTPRLGKVTEGSLAPDIESAFIRISRGEFDD